MKSTSLTAVLGLSLALGTMPSWSADDHSASSPVATTTIRIGAHDVPVVQGGLYDRFRSKAAVMRKQRVGALVNSLIASVIRAAAAFV